MPVIAVEVVDTTGAGDAFTAGLAVALAAGEDEAQALRLATAVGGLSHPGAGGPRRHAHARRGRGRPWPGCQPAKSTTPRARAILRASRNISQEARMTDTAAPNVQGSVAPRARAPRPIDPGVTIGHVHLRTADIDRVRAFYVDVLGFDVVAEVRDVPGWGTTGDMLFLSAGGYHHHLGFNTWKSAGGAAAARRRRRACTTSRSATRRAPALADALPAAAGGRLADPPVDRPRHARRDLHLRPRRQRPRADAGTARRASGRATPRANSGCLRRRPRPRRAGARGGTERDQKLNLEFAGNSRRR